MPSWGRHPATRRVCGEEMVKDIKGAAVIMVLMIVAGVVCKLAGWWPG